MAIKSETYPIVLKIEPDSSLNLNTENITLDLENSDIKIYNDRGGEITSNNPGGIVDKNQLFIDNNNLLIGYLWDTNDDRFNIQNYYLFVFLVAIKYKTDPETEKTFILSYSTKKLLEASSTINISILGGV